MPCEDLSHGFLNAAITARLAHIRVKSVHFVGLHAFYKDVYESMEGWFDRFAERARAEEEKVEAFVFDSDLLVKGDQIHDVSATLVSLVDDCKAARAKEGATTQSMIDEALEDLEKFLWQLKVMA